MTTTANTKKLIFYPVLVGERIHVLLYLFFLTLLMTYIALYYPKNDYWISLGICLFFFISNLIFNFPWPNSTYLKLTPQNLELKFLSRKTLIPWSHISAIEATDQYIIYTAKNRKSFFKTFCMANVFLRGNKLTPILQEWHQKYTNIKD